MRRAPDRRPSGRVPAAVPFVLVGVLVAAQAAFADRSALPMDLVLFAGAGASILTGDLAVVYRDDWMQGGPLEALASWLALPLPHQHHLAYQSDPQAAVWGGAVRAVVALLVVGALLSAVVLLRRQHGMPVRARPLLALLLLGVALRLPWLSVTGGHLAQVAVTGCWVLAAVAAARGRPVLAGVLVGAACGWEPWAVLGAPAVLLDPRLSLRRPWTLLPPGAAAAGVALALYLPFVLSGPFAMFDHEWFLVRDTVVGMLLPKGTPFGWPLRVLQAAGTVLVASAVALALRGRSGTRRDGVWLVPLTAQLTRLLLDPLDLGYYWFPVLALGLLGIGLLPGRPPGEPGRWTDWPGRTRTYLVVALVVLVNLSAVVPGQSAPSRLSTAMLAVGLGLVAVLVHRLRRDAAAEAPAAAAPVARMPAPRRPAARQPGLARDVTVQRPGRRGG